jgi:nucleolar protein 53
MYKKSAIPSIEIPHPGTSYNPDYDDHQDLLMKAHLVELKKLQEEQKLMRKLALHAKKMSWAEIEVDKLF